MPALITSTISAGVRVFTAAWTRMPAGTSASNLLARSVILTGLTAVRMLLFTQQFLSFSQLLFELDWVYSWFSWRYLLTLSSTCLLIPLSFASASCCALSASSWRS
jgi:hypothetical protein